MNVEQVLQETATLPVDDQLELIHQIWGGIADSGRDFELSDELKAELDRRLAAHEANPEAGIPWEQFKAELLARVRR